MIIDDTKSIFHGIFQLQFKVHNLYFRTDDDLVLLSFDDNYVDQSINLILSLKHNNEKRISVICACIGISKHNIEKLLSLDVGVQILVYNFEFNMEMGRWSKITLLRVFSPWILDRNIKKILYLDSDIICCGCIRDLFDIDVKYIAMGNEISGNVGNTQLQSYRKICPTQIYCNAGVVLLNLESIRSKYSFDEIYYSCIEICQKYPYFDQDFLNIFFDGKIYYFNGLHFNFQAYELMGSCKYNNALKQSKLIHFSCGKPWDPHTDRRLIKLYLKHSKYSSMIKHLKVVLRKNIFITFVVQIKHLLSKLKK